MKFFSGEDMVIINGRAVKKTYGGFATGLPAMPANYGYESGGPADWFGQLIDLIDNAGACQKLMNEFIEEEKISATILKVIESIRHDTGIDLSGHLKIEIFEMKRHSESPCVSECPEELQRKTPESPVSHAPKNYRGWNLASRGKNKKGEVLFNLAKKIRGKKQQKYLGVWNQEKADRIIDELSRNDGDESFESAR